MANEGHLLPGERGEGQVRAQKESERGVLTS